MTEHLTISMPKVISGEFQQVPSGRLDCIYWISGFLPRLDMDHYGCVCMFLDPSNKLYVCTHLFAKKDDLLNWRRVRRFLNGAIRRIRSYADQVYGASCEGMGHAEIRARFGGIECSFLSDPAYREWKALREEARAVQQASPNQAVWEGHSDD